MQKYDAEQDNARYKFDLERDEVQRRFVAAMLGVELKDNPAKTQPSSSNGRKKSMTAADIMANYSK